MCGIPPGGVSTPLERTEVEYRHLPWNPPGYGALQVNEHSYLTSTPPTMLRHTLPFLEQGMDLFL